MKKIFACFITLVLLISMTACSSNPMETGSSEPEAGTIVQPPGSLEIEPANGSMASSQPAESEGMPSTPGPAPVKDIETSKILIAYFTWADNTAVEDENAAIQSALNHYESMGDIGNYDGVDAVASASVVPPGNTAQMAGWIQQEVGGDLHSIVVEDPYPSDYDECLERAADEKADDARPVLSSHVDNMGDYDVVFLGFPNWWYTLPMPVLSFVEGYDWSGKTVIPFVTHGTGGLSATVRDLTDALPDDVTVLDPIGVYRPDIPHAQPEIQAWIASLNLEV